MEQNKKWNQKNCKIKEITKKFWKHSENENLKNQEKYKNWKKQKIENKNGKNSKNLTEKNLKIFRK